MTDIEMLAKLEDCMLPSCGEGKPFTIGTDILIVKSAFLEVIDSLRVRVISPEKLDSCERADDDGEESVRTKYKRCAYKLCAFKLLENNSSDYCIRHRRRG